MDCPAFSPMDYCLIYWEEKFTFSTVLSSVISQKPENKLRVGEYVSVETESDTGKMSRSVLSYVN